MLEELNRKEPSDLDIIHMYTQQEQRQIFHQKILIKIYNGGKVFLWNKWKFELNLVL